MDIAMMIKTKRKAQGLTQTELAERCDVLAPQLSNIENGNTDPRISTVNKILTGLGIELIPQASIASARVTTLDDVVERAERGKSTLIDAGIASPTPSQRLLRKADRGEDIRDEIARLAEFDPAPE